MLLTLAFGFLLALGELAQGPAQDKPDFSGEWILVSPSEPPAGTARKLTVAVDSSSVAITRASESGSTSADYKINAASSKGPDVAGTAGGSSTKSEARWIGSTLTIDDITCRRLVTVRSAPTTRMNDAEACEQRTEKWSAGPKPGLLTIERTELGPEKRASSATFVYRRPEH